MPILKLNCSWILKRKKKQTLKLLKNIPISKTYIEELTENIKYQIGL